MATTVTKVVDPNSGSGYNYASAYDWEAAQQGDLTGARNEIAVAKCRCTGGTADITGVTIDGWTTSATQYIKVWTDPSESYRHNGTYQTGNKYRLEITYTSGGVSCLETIEAFTQIIGLQIAAITSYSGGAWAIYAGSFTGSTATTIISHNIVKGVLSGACDNAKGITHEINDTAKAYIFNNIVIDFINGANTNIYGIRQSSSYSANLSYFYNNTIINCYNGIANSNGTAKALNNLIYSCTVAGVGTFLAGSGYNVTDLASMGYTVTGGATGDRLSKSFTFANAGADDFHLVAADTDSIGYGLNLYNDADYPFQTDIDGQDRGGAAASWDIGADEYVSSTAIEQEGFRPRNDDGTEATATWKADQDTNITLAADTAFRLRFLLKATGNPDSIDAQVEARVKPSGGAFGAWGKIN